jgi:hypothetical protein
MKTLKDYISLAEHVVDNPIPGDSFAINLREDCLIESYVTGIADDGVVIQGDAQMLALLENYGYQLEDIDPEMAKKIAATVVGAMFGAKAKDNAGPEIEVVDVEPEHDVEADVIGMPLVDSATPAIDEVDDIRKMAGLYKELSHAHGMSTKQVEQPAPNVTSPEIEETEFYNEAEYQGHAVPLNKPMQGDVKKSKVYVKDPLTGNIKKVNFGDPNMTIKKSNPARRRSFRARHHCENPGPKTKARYWSCRAW